MKLDEEQREEKKGKFNSKLSYCSVIPSMWKYHSIMFEWWMLHVLIMLFSSHSKKHREEYCERGAQQPESECGIESVCREEKMEERMEEKEKKIKHSRENSAAEKNVIYFLGNENENVSQREWDIRRFSFASRLFGLWFAFYFIYFLAALFSIWTNLSLSSRCDCEHHRYVDVAASAAIREWRSWRWKGIKALFVITSTTCMMIYLNQRHDQNETFLFKSRIMKILEMSRRFNVCNDTVQLIFEYESLFTLFFGIEPRAIP